MPSVRAAVPVSLALLACSGPTTPAPALVSYCPRDAAEVEARVDRALAALSPEQKAALTRGEFAPGNAWVVEGVPELEIPRLTLIDGPRGVGKRAGRATAFPVAIARGATWDPA